MAAITRAGQLNKGGLFYGGSERPFTRRRSQAEKSQTATEELEVERKEILTAESQRKARS